MAGARTRRRGRVLAAVFAALAGSAASRGRKRERLQSAAAHLQLHTRRHFSAALLAWRLHAGTKRANGQKASMPSLHSLPAPLCCNNAMNRRQRLTNIGSRRHQAYARANRTYQPPNGQTNGAQMQSWCQYVAKTYACPVYTHMCLWHLEVHGKCGYCAARPSACTTPIPWKESGSLQFAQRRWRGRGPQRAAAPRALRSTPGRRAGAGRAASERSCGAPSASSAPEWLVSHSAHGLPQPEGKPGAQR